MNVLGFIRFMLDPLRGPGRDLDTPLAPAEEQHEVWDANELPATTPEPAQFDILAVLAILAALRKHHSITYEYGGSTIVDACACRADSNRSMDLDTWARHVLEMLAASIGTTK